jgi:hypothetical protein
MKIKKEKPRQPTWGEGYRIGISAGIHEAINRIEDLSNIHGDSIPVDKLLEFLDKDADWSMQDIQGWDGVAMMDNMGDWKPGWWAIDN